MIYLKAILKVVLEMEKENLKSWKIVAKTDTIEGKE